MRFGSLLTVLLALCVFSNGSAALSADHGITAAQADQILAELRKIRELLEKGVPAAKPEDGPTAVSGKVSVTLRDSNALGREDAPLTLIEFADFQCPFCRLFHTTTFDQIKKNFVDTGKVRYVSRDLPLQMHDNAPQAASAARCAGEQHHFWELRHLLMLNQDKLGRQDFLGYAQQLNLNVSAFTRCLDEKRYDVLIHQDAADAAEVGVVGTPTFIIGSTLQKGSFEGIRIVGTQPYPVFEAKIRELLAERTDAAQPLSPDTTHARQ